MRFSWLLFFMLCIGNASYAQILMGLMFASKDKLNSDVVKMGLQVGANASTLNHLDDGNANLGLLLGFYTDIKLDEHWHLHTGAFPINYLGAGDLSLYALDDPDLNTILQGAKVRRKLAYLGMPFLLEHSLSPAWRIGLGPQLQFLFSAKDEFYKEKDQNELLYKQDLLEETHRLDYGLYFHTGYFLKQGEGLYLQLRYYLGIRDVMKNLPDVQANRSFQFIVGIPIKGTAALDE